MRIGNGKTIRNRLFTVFALTFFLCMAFSLRAEAKGKYKFTVTEGVLTGTYDGDMLKKTYVSLKKSGEKYKIVKPGTADSKIYYFNKEGIGKKYTGTAFIKIAYDGKTKKYYSSKGKLQKNKIAGNKKAGYHYVDSDGVAVTDKTTELAVKFVRAHTKASQTQSQKLSSCYYSLAGYRYKRYYTNLYPTAGNMKDMAYDMLKYKQGNCHRYAAAFVYIAKVLGYDSRVVIGSVSARSGGMTPHGWTEIKKDGRWYVCDPDMEYNNRVPSYMKGSTPCKTAVTRRCTITIKNGKVSWK